MVVGHLPASEIRIGCRERECALLLIVRLKSSEAEHYADSRSVPSDDWTSIAAENRELLSIQNCLRGASGIIFGRALLKSFKTARFIPGFRDGKPMDSTYETTEYVSANGRYPSGVSFR